MKIAYLVDSTSSLSCDDELSNMQNVYYLPLKTSEDIEKTSELNKRKIELKIIDKMKQEHLSMFPSYDDIKNVFERIYTDGFDVLVTSLVGSGLSNLQNLVYKEGLEKKITIIQLDSKGVGPLQLDAIRKFMNEHKSGSSLLDIQSKVQHMLNVSNSYAVVDDASFSSKQHKAADALIKSVLDVKQVITFDKKAGGKIKSLANFRNANKAIELMINKALEAIDHQEYHFYISNYEALDLALICEKILLDKLPNVSFSHVKLNDSVKAVTGKHCVCLSTVRN